MLSPMQAPFSLLPRALRIAFSVVLLGLLAASIYFAATYSGPYRWLAELQMRYVGSYYEKLTFLATCMLLLMPPLMSIGWLGPRFGAQSQAGSVDEQRAPAPDAATISERIAKVQRWAFAFISGAVLTFVGARDELEAKAGGALTTVSCEQLETTPVPEASWLELDCRPVWDATLEAEHNHGHYAYVPLVSDRWSSRQAVGAVLRIERNQRRDLDGPKYSGARLPDGMPGFVRTHFEEAGLRVERALVLELGEKPGDKAATARIFMMVGPVLMLVGLIGGVISWRRTAASTSS